MAAANSVNLPLSLQNLEIAIDCETDASVLRAVRNRVVQKLTDRIKALEAFTVVLCRPSGDQKQLAGCLPDDRLESLVTRAAKEFEMPSSTILLCRGSRHFGAKDMSMSLSDLGISEAAQLTCVHDAGCRRYWQLRIATESCEWEALIYCIEFYDQYDNFIPREIFGDITSNAERNAENVSRNAFDGRHDTFWETPFGSQKIGGWVSVAFAEPVAICKMRLKQHDHIGNAIRSFDLLSSEDGAYWTHVWTAAGLGPGWSEACAPTASNPHPT